MSETETLSAPVVSANAPPTVAVLGCGGGGINTVRRALPGILGRVSYRYLDTSKRANLQVGEDAIIIGPGDGSGGVRGENADAAVKHIASLSDADLGLADINIIVFSASGGSGSVIGPLLIGDIASRRKRLVIAVTISSTQSKMHTKNTLKTLQSLRNIADNASLYLPITIFNNNAGMQVVDKQAPYKLNRLVDLLTAPTVEIDKNDRLNWINVPKTLEEPLAGLRLLYVTTATGVAEDTSAEIWPKAPANYIYDSVLAIRAGDYEPIDRPRAQSSFEGLFSIIQLTPMYGVIGNPPKAFDDLVKLINDTLNDYNANTDRHDDPFGMPTGGAGQHKSGLVT
jgi:hypothetical protein